MPRIVLCNLGGIGLVVAVLLSSPLKAQDTPRAALLAGLGNPYGWIGGQGEFFIADGRVSAFVGGGYLPNLLNDDGDGIVGAGGVRLFVMAGRHQLFVETSVTALSSSEHSTVGSGASEVTIGYGPGVSLGYQYLRTDGMTVRVSGGIGRDNDRPDLESEGLFQPTIGLGIGYTWRR